MKTLVRFNLKRRIVNKMNLLTDLLITLAVFAVFYCDFFIAVQQEYTVYYDSSCIEYQSYFEQLTAYQLTNYGIKEDEILIHYDEGFVIACSEEVDEEVIEEVITTINQISKAYYKDHYGYLSDYIDEIDVSLQAIEVQTTETNNGFSVIASILYFMILNYANLVANEVAFEKFSGVSSLVLSQVSSFQHLASKVIIGWLSPLLKAGFIVIVALLAAFSRFSYDQFQGLNSLFSSLINTETSTASFPSLTVIVMSALLLFSGLLVIQILMMAVIIRIQNQQQASSLQGLIYILMLIVYVFLLQYGESIDFTSVISRGISFLPIVNMYMMSCRFLIKNATVIEGLVAIIINLVTLVLSMKCLLVHYKENLTS